jgi:D-alanine-D-alanine ligase
MKKVLEIGIAYDLRADFEGAVDGPEDRLEEYDAESTVQAIAAVIEKLGHRPRPLGGGRRLVEAVLAHPPDLVFNFAEGFGTRSREAHVPALLEMLRLPFTHSDPLTLAVSLDKAITKRLVAPLGVPTPAFAVLSRPDEADSLELDFPVIAKPIAEGSSMGIRKSSRITSRAALREHLARLVTDYAQPVLVEEFCSGPEFTVGVLGTGPTARVIGMMEIVPQTDASDTFVYSLEVKRNWEKEVRYDVPPKRPAPLLRRVEEVALAAYRALECRDVARVDLRVGKNGEPMFLEVNPLPGLDPVKSDIVILARGMGVSYDALIGGIIESARARHQL